MIGKPGVEIPTSSGLIFNHNCSFLHNVYSIVCVMFAEMRWIRSPTRMSDRESEEEAVMVEMVSDVISCGLCSQHNVTYFDSFLAWI